jgi:coenzyme F420-reducing hydrogenase delta subunit/NAD-dependent dihydropyrimidine dehydrogenase PreA subunit
MIDKAQDATSPRSERARVMRVFETAARRCTRAIDGLLHRVYGWRWNPVHQSGALAAWLLVVLTVTGIYLLLFYRVGSPAASVQRIAADPWLGAWMRTLHRYATDAFLIAAVLHAVRLVGQAREWGPRTRAWLSGVFLFGVGLACAWTGFVMAWDSFGMRLAVVGARMFDALPILSEPVSRIFAGDRPVPEAFFFLNLFIHIAFPLAMGAGLWLHVSKVARPVLAPPAPLKWRLTAVLFALSVLVPAPLGPAANALDLPQTTPLALTSAWWVPLAEGQSPWVVWSVVLVFTIAVLAVPFVARRTRTGSWEPSVVNPRYCTGCDSCTQDCPWGAIQMVPRDDDRPTLVALVDPALCVSCGICAGSCPPMGVGPPGRTGRDQLAQLRADLLPAVQETPREGRVVVVRCEQGSPDVRRRLVAAGATVHDVPCVGGVHTSFVELLVRQGATGVMVTGCPPRDCVGREGPKWLEQRFYHAREAELQPRVDRERVAVITAALGEDEAVVAAFETFRRRMLALDVIAAEAEVELEEYCEPVSAEVDR